MTNTGYGKQNKRNNKVTAYLLCFNLILILFPPIYIGMANGNLSSALIYAIGSSIVLTVSLFILPSTD